jgi:DNA-binding helix-hairpin-helix protein with protein kinase domain
VGAPTFTAPELHGLPLDSTVRTQNHDAFGLAVLIFNLLFLGRHPFAGRYLGKGEMPPERAIRELRFAFGKHAASKLMAPPPFTPALELVPPAMAELFEASFDKSSVLERPSAQTWRGTLTEMLRGLVRCPREPAHVFPSHRTSCPWCAVVKAGGPVFFVTFEQETSTELTCRPSDLDAAWAELEQLRLPPVDPGPDTLRDVHVPDEMRQDARILTDAGNVAVGAGWGVAGALFASVLVNTPALLLWLGGASVLVLLGALGTWLWIRRASPYAATLERSIQAREREIAAGAPVLQTWREATSAFQSRFDGVLPGLREAKEEYGGLRREYRRELTELYRHAEASQRRAFLDTLLIAHHDIPSIGPGRKAMLRAAGVFSASDVLRKNLRLQGFGDDIHRKLRLWVKSVEKRFRFDPKRGIPEIARRELYERFRQRQQSLRAFVDTELDELRRLRALVPEEAVRLAPVVQAVQTAIAHHDAELAAVRELESFAGPVKHRRLSFAVQGVVSVLCATLLLTSPSPEAATESTTPGRAFLPRRCTVHAQAALDARPLGSLEPSAAVAVTEILHGWRRVTLRDGKSGWTPPSCWAEAEAP